jgi:AcrR family transcriptional regulator
VQPPTSLSRAATRRGRPRSAAAQRAILAAVADLLRHRPMAQMSMDAVAARAGVSKATIYRWWPTKEALALDALCHEWGAVSEAIDTGALRGNLLGLLRPWAHLAATRPYGRIVAALVSQAQNDPEFGRRYRERFVEPRRDQARAILRQAVERGEIQDKANIEVAIDLLYGPIYHRVLHGHAPVTDMFVRDVVDAALHGIARPEQDTPASIGA